MPVEHEAEARSRPRAIQVAEHAANPNAVVVAVVLRRPERPVQAVGVEVDRQRFALPQVVDPVADVAAPDIEARVHAQRQRTAPFVVDERAGDLVGQRLQGQFDESLTEPDRDGPEIEGDALVHQPLTSSPPKRCALWTEIPGEAQSRDSSCQRRLNKPSLGR